ncbi:MAG: adenosylcobinamide amidohydrolase [Nitrospiraceae bacterium]
MNRSTRNRVHVKYRITRDTLVIDLGAVHRVLSSAPLGGGLVRARSILNHQVAANPATRPSEPSNRRSQRVTWRSPARYLGSLASELDAAVPSIGLMTAVPMKQLVAFREESNGLWVECFCTVGVTNAVKAGESVSFKGLGRRCCTAGTINIILVTNGTLSISAMVGAVQVVTESKTAALGNRAVPSWTGRGAATGTGTDAVVIVCRLRGRYKIQYSGTHTKIGAMIGRLVGRCVEAGLDRTARWEHRNNTKRVATRGTKD